MLKISRDFYEGVVCRFVVGFGESRRGRVTGGKIAQRAHRHASVGSEGAEEEEAEEEEEEEEEEENAVEGLTSKLKSTTEIFRSFGIGSQARGQRRLVRGASAAGSLVTCRIDPLRALKGPRFARTKNTPHTSPTPWPPPASPSRA